VFYCECSKPAVYMCKKHPGLHIVQKGKHDLISLVSQPEPEEAEFINQNISPVLKLLSEIRLSIINRTKQLFESIYELEKEAIRIIEQYEKRVKNLYDNFKNDDDIYKEENKLFADIANSCIDRFKFDIQNVLKELKPLYSIELTNPKRPVSHSPARVPTPVSNPELQLPPPGLISSNIVPLCGNYNMIPPPYPVGLFSNRVPPY
jgi:hypothetical protein